MNRPALALAALAVLGAASLYADEKKPTNSGVAWYATWDRALEDAKRSNRPILLIAAAPQCHGISGLW